MTNNNRRTEIEAEVVAAWRRFQAAETLEEKEAAREELFRAHRELKALRPACGGAWKIGGGDG